MLQENERLHYKNSSDSGKAPNAARLNKVRWRDDVPIEVTMELSASVKPGFVAA